MTPASGGCIRRLHLQASWTPAARECLHRPPLSFRAGIMRAAGVFNALLCKRVELPRPVSVCLGVSIDTQCLPALLLPWRCLPGTERGTMRPAGVSNALLYRRVGLPRAASALTDTATLVSFPAAALPFNASCTQSQASGPYLFPLK